MGRMPASWFFNVLTTSAGWTSHWSSVYSMLSKSRNWSWGQNGSTLFNYKCSTLQSMYSDLEGEEGWRYTASLKLRFFSEFIKVSLPVFVIFKSYLVIPYQSFCQNSLRISCKVTKYVILGRITSVICECVFHLLWWKKYISSENKKEQEIRFYSFD